MPFGRGRNWFGRGFWKRGFYGAPGSYGGFGGFRGYWGRGRGRGLGNPFPFYRRVPWLPRGWWAAPSYGQVGYTSPDRTGWGWGIPQQPQQGWTPGIWRY
jgi:hypothetical protein